MKTLRFLLVTVLLVVCAWSLSNGQVSKKPFSGVIKYGISYPDSAKFDASIRAALPKEMTTYIMGSMKKSEISGGMANQTEMTDAQAGTRSTLLDVMGQKFIIISSKEEIEKKNAEEPAPVVNYLDQTKEIAGYICKQAEIITKNKNGKENKVIVFYTDKLPGKELNFDGDYRTLDGFPLAFTVNEDRISMVFTATSVTKCKLKKKEFVVPEGYKQVTEEELKNMFGGGDM
ncbi:MAG: hypothetical protein NT175_06570 [Bacteroidetes bacterium]|nr:hypothetical protein [Bacteroidota bacterium]